MRSHLAGDAGFTPRRGVPVGRMSGHGGGMREIEVVFSDNTTGFVSENKLDELIASGRIKSFLRSDGWVRIGVDPIREKRYHGTNRRKGRE